MPQGARQDKGFFVIILTSQLFFWLAVGSVQNRVHRVATAAFWRTFQHEGKSSPGWWVWGVHAHPLSLHLPSPVKLQCTLQLSRQTWGRRISHVSSLVKICTQCTLYSFLPCISWPGVYSQYTMYTLTLSLAGLAFYILVESHWS